MKTKTKPPAETPSSTPPPAFYVLDAESEGDSHGTLTAHGPFLSRAAAEEWLCKDGADAFYDSTGGSLRDLAADAEAGTWGGPMIIVQTVATVRQCPEVRIRVSLRPSQ